MISFSVTIMLCAACFCIGMAVNSLIHQEVFQGVMNTLLAFIDLAIAIVFYVKG